MWQGNNKNAFKRYLHGYPTLHSSPIVEYGMYVKNSMNMVKWE